MGKDMNPPCHICDPTSCIKIVLKSYRSGLKVLRTLSKVRDGGDKFPEQSGSSQTDPKVLNACDYPNKAVPLYF